MEVGSTQLPLVTFMFWITVYLVTTYGLALLALGGCIYALSRWAVPRKTRLALAAILAVFFLLLPLWPYAQVAWQTQQYGDELLPVFMKEARHTISGEITTPPLIFRVLEYSPRRAVVYAVESCGETNSGQRWGWTMKLRTKGRGWEFSEYDAVWSDCGSAEGNTFPPYPEPREF